MSDALQSRFRVTADDIRQYDWLEVLNLHPKKECVSYYEALCKRASELKAAGDDLGERVFGLLYVVASFGSNYDSRANPYGPLWTNGNNRSLTPDDLTDEDLATLQAILGEITDPEFRARVGDVVWECKRDYKAAQVAVHAFVESARVLETDDLWPSFVERLERAAQLSARLGFGKPLHQEVIVEIEAVIARFENNAKAGRLCACLMRILLDHDAGDPSHYASLAEAHATRLSGAGEWNFSQEYWQTATAWFRRSKNDAEASRCELAAAECMVSQAEDILAGERPSFGSAAHWAAVGLGALRQAKADPTRIHTVHTRLLELQLQARSEISPLELDENAIPGFREEEKKTQEASASHVSGHLFQAAIARLALIRNPTNAAELRDQVEKEAQTHVFSHLFESVALDHSGKVADTASGMLFAEPEKREEALRASMVRRAMEIDWQIQVVWIIEPARRAILREHGIRVRDLVFLVANNPFIPEGHEGIYARGIQAGFFGDWLAAMHLLIPQIEASLRHVFQQTGVITSTLESDGTQKERDLNALLWLPDMERIFGPNIAFDLRGILIERFGYNMRNESAHGLMPEGAFYQHGAVYLWWLALRLCWLGFQMLHEPAKTD